MKIFVPDYSSHAGKWIYAGIANAWKQLGHQPIIDPAKVDTDGNSTHHAPMPEHPLEEDYIMMFTDHNAENSNSIFRERVANSYKSFVFVQPHMFQ